MTAKDIAKLREDVIHREAASKAATEAATATGSTRHTGVTKAVVTSTLLLVRQHVISLSRLLELLLGLLITRILVGVILDSRLAVGLLYLIGIGVLLDAQHLVVISLFCHSFTLLQQPLCNATPAHPACSHAAQHL